MSDRDVRGLLEKLFGRLKWEPPRWVGRLNEPGTGSAPGELVKAHASSLLASLVLLGMGVSIVLWQQAHPPPPPPDKLLLAATVVAPTPPPPRKRTDPVPGPAMLWVQFTGSAAPLDQLGKPVLSHVKLSPALPGEWKWMNERSLVFAPVRPWPLATHFTVELDEALVSRPNVLLQTHQLEFDTAPFAVKLSSAEFYQDPVDPLVKQVVATYDFNYPVDPASFEKAVKLTSAPVSNGLQKASHRLSISYDDLHFQAWVRSEPLPLPLEDHQATLLLSPGVKPEVGGSELSQELSRQVVIPGKGNRFKVEQVQASIARSADGDPDQVLIFSCTSEVSEKKFAEAVKVWVLPKDKPKNGALPAVKGFDWSGSATEIGPELLKKATRLKLEPIPGERESGTVHSFKVDAAPGAYLFVRVEKGIEAFGGYVLMKPYEAVASVPEYPRELRISHEGAVLSLTGDKKLTVTARGLPAFRVHLYRIQGKDLNHLITQSGGDFAHLAMRGSLTEENVSELFTEVKPLDPSNPKVAQYAAVDFAPYLKEGGGFYFVQVEAWDPVSKTVITRYSKSHDPSEESAEPAEGQSEEGYQAVDRGGSEEGGEGEGEGEGEGGYEGDEGAYGQLSDKRFVLLTDLGVIDKLDAQANHWVFVQSFKTGNPVGGAQVEVLAKNGQVVLKRATDPSGAVTLPPLKDFTADKYPVALVVRSDADVSFLPFNRSDRNLDFSRFDVGGVRTQGRPAALNAYAFTDRGLYRPSETAHLSTIVRAVDWSRSMKGVPLELTVVDPRALVVKRQRLALDATGFVSLDFTPEQSAPTGTYAFNISVAEDKKAPLQLGSTTFRVEEFLPDRMRMTTRFEQPTPGWVVGSKLQAGVELKNLFGTPAADHAVHATFSLAPYQPWFAKYSEYSFFDPARAKRGEEQRLTDSETDEHGQVKYTLDLSPYAPATYQVSFYAEGFELGGGRSVSSVANVVVSPRKYLLGFKADGDLGFIKRGVDRKVQLIAVDPQLARVKVEGLKVSTVEQRFVSVLTKDPSGSYRYQSVMKDVTRKTEALSVAEPGTTLSLASSDVGSFYLVVKDSEDVELLRVPYSVAGEANVAKDLERNAELKISLDKPEYEPGETVTVQITAPYAGAGVITIERDKVYVHKAFKTTTSTTVQTLEVPRDLEANGYVNVAFVRDLASPELFVSPLSYGVQPFKVLKRSQHLELGLKSEPLARPGRPMKISFHTSQPAKIAVFAVDEGILQVARYETPDPLAFFLARRALEVSTRQIVDQLLPEFGLVHGKGREGGDDDAAALARNLNPFKRKADLPGVFWSRIVDSGPDEKTVTFDVPESFAGQLRVMAVAAAPQALAAAKTQTTVRGPFVIAPNTPTFASPGDRLTVTAAIANNVEGSGDQAQIEVKLATNAGLEVLGAQKQVLTIAEGREAVASFEVRATDALGEAQARFLVSGAKQEGVRTATLSVRPPSAYRVVSQVGAVKGGVREVKVQRRLYDPLSTRELTVSLLPLGIGAGLVDYLESYPHLCSEQLSSRAAPALVFMKRPEFGYPQDRAKAAWERAFSILRQRQNEEGQFGYWAANSFVSDPLDVYIALMLTEAKERGAPAPADVRQKALTMVKGLAMQSLSDWPSARLKAFALYVLARNDVTAPGPTAELAEWLNRQKGPKNDLAHAYLAGTWALTNNKDAAQKAIDQLELSDKVLPDPQHAYDDHTYRAQVLYLVAKHFPQKLEAVGPRLLGLLAESISRGLHSLSAAWSLYALDAYATALEGSGVTALSGLSVERQEGGAWKPVELARGLTARSTFDGAATAYRLTVKDGPMVFYSLTEAGFDRDPPTTAVKQGIELIHTFESDDGQPVTRVALGDEINVHLQTRSLVTGQTLYQVAVTDLLPAGFELVLARGDDVQGLDRLVASGATWRPEQLDAREDRVVFYGNVPPAVQQLSYKIKAVAKGTFVLPPTQANGMYDPNIVGRSTSASITVE
ncbi:MAG: alpha-2-macroglobulin family protein [Archangiaceae bacterium]|nr:alpha-2-macroglobulin family protein [Archangiaceae bacterium]